MPSQTHTRRPIRPIAERTTKELQNLRNNYIRAGRMEGGLYSLAEVNRELFHRLECSEIAGEKVVGEIASMIRGCVVTPSLSAFVIASSFSSLMVFARPLFTQTPTF